MLTADLVRVRKRKGALEILTLDTAQEQRAQEFAERYVALAHAHVGRTRVEFEDACAAVSHSPQENKLALGLLKLVTDQCEFETQADQDPVLIRRELFLRAAQIRKQGSAAPWDRSLVLAKAAQELACTVQQLEQSLYADLADEQVLTKFQGARPRDLVAGLSLAQAQAMLLRATHVELTITGANPATYRALFRKIKFHRLLHRIEPFLRKDQEGYRILIDGPLSLFGPVQKYGLELALLLPVLAHHPQWFLEAEVRWGPKRNPLKFTYAPENKHPREAFSIAEHVSDELLILCNSLNELKSSWRASFAQTLLELPGLGLIIPDLVFTNHETGELIYFEKLGFWSRAAVWKRAELVEQGLPYRVLFAVSEKLRVSEEILHENLPSALYVYKTKINARTVLERITSLAERTGK